MDGLAGQGHRQASERRLILGASNLARRMVALADSGVSRITLHATLHRLAWGISGVFSGTYLFRQGMSPTEIFLVFSAIIAARFLFRPLVLVLAPFVGLRRLLILGTALQATQYPALAAVHGLSWQLWLFAAATVLGGVVYWTCFHAMYGSLGDTTKRGSQVATRQIFTSSASVLGPALGGIMLTTFGAWVAFGTAAAIELAGIVPLLRIGELPFQPVAPPGGYTAARTGFLLFLTDGWLQNSALMAWNLIMFESLGDRFDAFGGVFAAALLAGSLPGFVSGRVIDMGHARRVAWTNAAALAATLLLKAVCGVDPLVIVMVAIGTTFVGGLYSPAVMTAFYNECHAAPCALRYQVTAEAGWDIGGASASLLAAATCALGQPLQVAILIAVPMAIFQGYVVDRSYAKFGGALKSESSIR
jgi:MFS transporter, DHA1 family, inner membrane transport protein